MSAITFLEDIFDDLAQQVEEAREARGGLTIIEALTVTEGMRRDFEAWAISAAFERLGLDFEADIAVSEAKVTGAINTSVLEGTGLELTNIFSKEDIQGDLERFALDKVNEALGGEVSFRSFKADSMKKTMMVYIKKMVTKQVRDGSGPLVDALGDNEDIVGMIEAYESSINEPLSDADGAEENRNRQARYRAEHGRHWEEK